MDPDILGIKPKTDEEEDPSKREEQERLRRNEEDRRRKEEEQKQKEEKERLRKEEEQQKRSEKERRKTVGKKPENNGGKIPGRKRWRWALIPVAVLLLLVLPWLDFGGTEDDPQPATTTEEDQGQDGEKNENLSEGQTWKNNVLMSDDGGLKAEDYVFTSTVKRKEITSVTFLDTVQDAPPNAWDVSEVQDGSVLAWTISTGKYERYDLYIAGEGVWQRLLVVAVCFPVIRG